MEEREDLIRRKLAEKLRKARKSVGLNQNQVADYLGICRNKLINIEKGIAEIDIILLEKMAKYYGYSLAYFLEDDSKEDEELSFAFRATELTEEDSYIPAWGRKLLLNLRLMEEICREVGI